MNKKIICVNGPPGAGKDETLKHIRALISKNKTLHEEKFAQPLGEGFKGIFNIKDEETYNYWREEHKDEPLFDNPKWPSLREMFIFKSESFLKKLFGDNIFAELFLMRLEDHDVVVVTDSGFQYEFNYVKENSNEDYDVHLFQVLRDGHNYDNDSRQYVYDIDFKTGVDNTVYIDNNGTLEDLKKKVIDETKKIL